MVVHIQKKIKSIWRTVLTVDSVHSSSALEHLCRQYCQYKFRISTEKTDDMPVKLRGFSKNEALDALYDLKLADLTWRQATEAFIKITDIIEQVCKRYQR
jgi:hypothetical protein